VNFGWNQDENAPGIVEEEPGEQQRGKYAREASSAVEREAAGRRWGHAAQASRTDEAVLMLYDTLAAIVIRAIWTAANRFPVRMMQATLVGKCGDGGVLTVKRLRVVCVANLAGDE